MWCKCAYAQNATMPITNQINIVYDSFCGKPCSPALGELQQHLEQTYELKHSVVQKCLQQSWAVERNN